MTAENRPDGYGWEEAFMALLLAILIPVLLLAANLDLRPQPSRPSQQTSLIDHIKVWSNDGTGMPDPAGPIVADAAPTDSAEGTIAGAENAAVARSDQDEPASGADSPDASKPDGVRASPMMAVDFSLADFDAAGLPPPSRKDAGVTVTKTVLMGDQRVGKVDITIESEGRLLLEAQAVRALLDQQAGKPANSLKRLPEQGLVSFAQLRDLGIDLRYSPNEDAIRLNP